MRGGIVVFFFFFFKLRSWCNSPTPWCNPSLQNHGVTLKNRGVIFTPRSALKKQKTKKTKTKKTGIVYVMYICISSCPCIIHSTMCNTFVGSIMLAKMMHCLCQVATMIEASKRISLLKLNFRST